MMSADRSYSFELLDESISRLQRIKQEGVRERLTLALTLRITKTDGLSEQQVAQLLLHIFAQTPIEPKITPDPTNRDQYIKPEVLTLGHRLGRVALSHLTNRGSAFLAKDAADMAEFVRGLAMGKGLLELSRIADETKQRILTGAVQQALKPAR